MQLLLQISCTKIFYYAKIMQTRVNYTVAGKEICVRKVRASQGKGAC